MGLSLVYLVSRGHKDRNEDTRRPDRVLHNSSRVLFFGEGPL